VSAIREAIPRTPELERALLRAFSEGSTTVEAAARVSISAALVYKWAKADPAFSARLTAARPPKGTTRAQPKPRLTDEQKARRRKGWCVDRTCGACLSCTRRATMLRLHADGRMQPKRAAWNVWTLEEDAVVRRHAGTLGEAEAMDLIAARLREECGSPRTPLAVRKRASTLGVSLAIRGHLTLEDLTRLFGSGPEAIIARILRPGLLPSRRGGGRSATWWVAERDVERFIRERPWDYDPAALDDSRLGKLGRVLHAADPWLTQAQAAAWIGAATRCSVARWRARGLIEFRLRLLGHRGGRTGGVWVIRRADLVRAAPRVMAAREENMRRGRLLGPQVRTRDRPARRSRGRKGP
jgi:hypothetical protein